jgi:hypothetical protein
MWGTSFTNLLMYLHTIPSYELDGKKDEGKSVDGLDELKGLIDI